MTQLIGLVSPRSVLLATDRRVTSIATGEVIDDDTCKIVSLCNTAGIAYTGLAAIDGIPTHEWICHRLVDASATRAAQAVPTLASTATRAFNRLKYRQLYPHTFLLAGYDVFQKQGLAPHLALVTNMRDASGRTLRSPARTFHSFLYVKPITTRLYAHFEGAHFPDGKRAALVRNLGRAFSRECSDEPMLRLLGQAILERARRPIHAVGERVLTMAIPQASLPKEDRLTFLLSGPASTEVATFGYLVPGATRVRQVGPAFACGQSAMVDLETENDPSRDYQSSSFRILRMPGSPPAGNAAT